MQKTFYPLSLIAASLLLYLSHPLQLAAITPTIAQAQTPSNQNRKAQADRLNQLGIQQYRQGKLREALETFEKVLLIRREIGDKAGEGTTLNNLGVVYRSLGQYAKAIDYYQQALAIFKQIGDTAGVGRTLNNLGAVYDSQGQYAKAIDYYQQALAIFKQIGDTAGVGTILNNLGLVYDNQGQYAKAIEYYQQALAIIKQIGGTPVEGKILNNLGAVYKNQGQYAKAIEYYQQALVIRKQIGDTAGEATTLNNLGLVYDNQGQYAKAIDYYQQALAIFKQIGGTAGVGTILNNLGLVYDNQGQYAKAIEYYQQALAIVKQIGDTAGVGATLNNLGVVYDNQGQYAKAIDYYQQALVIRKQIGDTAGESTTLNNLGGVYKNQGQYAKAIEYYQQALAIFKQIVDTAGVGTILNNLGAVYDNQGQYAKAMEYYQQALVIRKQIGDTAGEATTLNNLGLVYDNQGQYAKAIDYYQQALVIAKQIGDTAGEGTTLSNLGEVYRSQGQYAKAIEYFQQALAIFKQIGDTAGEGTTFNNLGGVYDNQGQYAKAIDYYQQALVIAKQIGDTAGEGTTLSNIGYAFWQTGKLQQATETLRAGIKVSESLRIDLKDTDKISLIDTQLDSYKFLQQALIAQKQPEAALEISERSRARAFVELLASKFKSNTKVNSNPPTINQLKQIAKEQKATFVEYSIIREKFKTQKKSEWHESKLYIWVIKPTGEVTFHIKDITPLWQKDNTTLAELVTTSRQSVGVRGRGIFDIKFNPDNQQHQLKKLHELLIQPIADQLPLDPNQRVIFIPQDSLFQVPFAALQDQNGKYLIEKHTILTAPAIQVLDLTHKQQRQFPQSPDEMLIVGNPTMPKLPITVDPQQRTLKALPGAEREAKAIAQLFKTQAIIGKNATERAITQKLPQAKLIHLATHGLLDDFLGLGVPGAIALAPDTPPSNDDNGDGLLTAGEILDLQLSANLVVLSACDTGGGSISGDGVIGLSRSLISAGAESVLVSLWSVDDQSTAFLMTEFYQNLQKNLDKATALRMAMLATKEKYQSPLHWAAFTLIGESE
ncbi:tetratricopeptide repeat protein [Nostoc sp. CENA67]|uniref:Tetratricopeptide repeat protein n=1 Tax=Amazonocrinis nigriterrae CENA67 TaxID=2794033 RepID=A0A8J7HV62_9NOST|nr:tetratricopeptide repeat protein [Amazonocrinis nigriterrae]MBH8566197.1 tetratricopeptide repeat protein [Amazonocrinis nigriterrae CENA67]